MSNPELTLQNVVFGYKNGGRLFNGLNVTVRGGQLLLVYGPNGSGKSTLLKLMAGLLKPQAGAVLLNGTFVSNRHFSKIGYVMQRAEDQFFCETVFDEVAFSAKNFGFHDVDELVKEALAEVGLRDDVLDRSPFQLSEGEARRVAIACALVHKPLLLLLDEPLIGLDRIGRQMVQDILKRQKQAGKIIVVTSHRSDNLRDLADVFLTL
ncbi:MAG: ABC transporter related [Thermotoga sp. 50_1627]|uniref:energy-coupling factor ABC transporter ATP-binding protein n=1 Tax=Pseudothermotoga sp. TaxID=2033661 RepID=UPI00076C1B9B|nr:MAG: ABC transporter related [Thermotoga sp. 50_64]KUK25915.1 MAG: ABC transporter related [Thermotoga sp. 50_1627]MBC7116103.1 ABC transporter ATP-binding protein [Pseudothermotoga sp.]MDK2922792.1 energy-coupling factor transport system ATP-binding protein [Pseudothermotoga sp.]